MNEPHIEKAQIRIYLMVDTGTKTIMTRDIMIEPQQLYKIANCLRSENDFELQQLGMKIEENLEKFKYELLQKRGLNRGSTI